MYVDNDEDNIDCGIQTLSLKSWEEFYPLFTKGMANKPAYVFRGQADADWLVESSIDRFEKKYNVQPNFISKIPKVFNGPPVLREVHLEAFRYAIQGRRKINPSPLTDDECWAMAQHHGLVTPLVDWTFSPFVSLYFAFEDEFVNNAQGNSTTPNNRAVYALSTSVIEEKSTDTEPGPLPYVPAVETSDRIVAQSGLFLKMPRRMDLEGYIRRVFANESTSDNRHPRATLKKIVIPNQGRIECLKALNKMNVNRMTLFPDLDGAARYINMLWELHWDTSLGHITEGALGARLRRPTGASPTASSPD